MKYLPVALLAYIVIFTSSCTNVKNLQYLQGTVDTAKLSRVQIPTPVIQKGDLLGITVYSDDPLATAAVTRQTGASLTSTPAELNTGSTAMPTSATASGYLVNQQGNLQLYKLGTIHAEGLTKEKLADTLAMLYSTMNLLKNPYVEIRFLNYKITVIGEVSRPGSYSVPSDKINAFEAIGLAGDITLYGRRDNVLVIREINGVRQFGRIDLTNSDAFLSPYYYLQQNDLVIVDVGKNKATMNNQTTMQYVSIGTSLLSVIAVLVSLFRR